MYGYPISFLNYYGMVSNDTTLPQRPNDVEISIKTMKILCNGSQLLTLLCFCKHNFLYFSAHINFYTTVLNEIKTFFKFWKLVIKLLIYLPKIFNL